MSAKTNVLNWGLGREFNITLIAALLSLVVALVTSLITSRIAAGNTRENCNGTRRGQQSPGLK